MRGICSLRARQLGRIFGGDGVFGSSVAVLRSIKLSLLADCMRLGSCRELPAIRGKQCFFLPFLCVRWVCVDSWVCPVVVAFYKRVLVSNWGSSIACILVEFLIFLKILLVCTKRNSNC